MAAEGGAGERQNDTDEDIPLNKTRSLEATAERGSLTGSTKSAADFEKAIKETECAESPYPLLGYKINQLSGYGKFNYLLLLLAFPASCSSTFESTALSYALPTATCDLKLNAYDRGYLNAAIYAGMIVSAFFWGFVADKYGRQRILMFGYLGDVIFGVCVSLSQSFWSLLFFKFLSGVMISGPFATLMSYLSELFSKKHRDSVVMMFGLFQAIGGIFQPMIAWAIIPYQIKWELLDGLIVINSWRLFLLVSTLPSLVAGVGTAFCYESPRFLLAKGRKDEALKVFRSIYSFNTGKPADTYSVRKLRRDPSQVDQEQEQTFWLELTGVFRPPHLSKALLVFAIQFGCLMTFNSIRLWLPQLIFYIKQLPEPEILDTCEILTEARHSSNITSNCDNFKVDTSVYTNMLFVSVLTSISFSVSAVTVSCIGKRNLLVGMFMLQSVAIVSLGWVSPPYTIILAAIFVSLANTVGIGLLGFVVQVFPTHLRAMSVSLTMMFGRVGVVLGNALLPFVLSLSCRGTFVGVSIITLICGLVLLVLAAAASKSETTKSPPIVKS